MQRNTFSLSIARHVSRWLLGLFLFLSAFQVQALDVPPSFSQLDLLPHGQILEDVDGGMLLGELLAPHADLPWQDIQTSSLSFGLTDSHFWFRVPLRAGLSASRSVIVEADNAIQDYVDFYLVDAESGDVLKDMFAGDRRPFDLRENPGPQPAMGITLEPGKVYWLYLKLASHDGLFESVPLKLWEAGAYAVHEEEERFVYGIYYGALIAMLVYNALLFVVTREKAFFFYAGYLLAFLFWNASFRGWAFLYWWPESPVWSNQAIGFALIALFGFLSLFTSAYLDTAKTIPWGHRLMWGVFFLISLAFVPNSLDNYALTWGILLPFGTIFMGLVLVLSAVLAWRRQRSARIFLAAWLILFASAMIYNLSILSVLPSNIFFEYAIQFGSGFEFLILALGLADRINVLKQEKMDYQVKALEAERQMTHELEAQVEQRTLELNVLNRKLAQQVITDGLTGLFNRRHFNDSLTAALEALSEGQQGLALMIIDVDNFKAYNDLYGHPQGDTVLERVGHSIRDSISQVDGQAFRIGGEEFACLFRAESDDAALSQAEMARQAVLSLQIPHERNVVSQVSISAGLARVDGEQQRSLKEVYHQADEALYTAKQQGRNQISPAWAVAV